MSKAVLSLILILAGCSTSEPMVSESECELKILLAQDDARSEGLNACKNERKREELWEKRK